MNIAYYLGGSILLLLTYSGLLAGRSPGLCMLLPGLLTMLNSFFSSPTSKSCTLPLSVPSSSLSSEIQARQR